MVPVAPGLLARSVGVCEAVALRLALGVGVRRARRREASLQRRERLEDI